MHRIGHCVTAWIIGAALLLLSSSAFAQSFRLHNTGIVSPADASDPGWSFEDAPQSPSSVLPAAFPDAAPHVRLAFNSSIPRDNTGDIQFVQHSGAMPQSVADSQTWVVVAPYLWAPAVEGTVGALGTKQNVDLTLSELIDLIPDLNGAFMGHVEVGKGPRGLIFDAMIMEVSPTEPGPLGGKVTVDSNTTILEFLGMYRVVDLGTSGENAPPVRVDVLGGVRYYDIETGLVIKPIVGPTLLIEQAENWVDLVVGTRGAVTLVQGLDAFLRADVGGFGIGTSSKLAWNLVVGVEYACASWPGSSLLLGYRVLDIDESKYSGVQHFVFDVKMQGPFLALGFRF